MAAEMHIRRWPENSDWPDPIALEEWKVAVEQCEFVRLCTEEFWTNPVTQRRMGHKVQEGDVEVFDGSHWILAIHWVSSGVFQGSAFFNVRAIEDWHREDWLLGRAICLCETLNAHLVTDELSVLDLHTFENVRQLDYPVVRELKQGVGYALGQLASKLREEGFNAEADEIAQRLEANAAEQDSGAFADYLHSIARIQMLQPTRILFADTASALRDAVNP